MVSSLADVALGRSATVREVAGTRTFRRRLLEMGLVPVAPLGDPIQIEVRGGQWSIRRDEAAQIVVSK
jgi:ferrous iron transport protein A